MQSHLNRFALRATLEEERTTPVADPEALTDLDEEEITDAVWAETEALVAGIVDEECEITDEGEPVDDLCMDEGRLIGVKNKLKNVIGATLGLVRRGDSNDSIDDVDVEKLLDTGALNGEGIPEGEILERGWEMR